MIFRRGGLVVTPSSMKQIFELFSKILERTVLSTFIYSCFLALPNIKNIYNAILFTEEALIFNAFLISYCSVMLSEHAKWGVRSYIAFTKKWIGSVHYMLYCYYKIYLERFILRIIISWAASVINGDTETVFQKSMSHLINSHLERFHRKFPTQH